MFSIRITDKDGMQYVAHLGEGYDDRTRIEPYQKGIVVTHPEKTPVYINGSTRQISRDPEVCRTDLIVNPKYVSLGRDHG